MIFNAMKKTLYATCIAVSSLAMANGVAAQELTSTSNPACVDHDGDGWGWDGSASCLIEGFVAVAGECIDFDGDGWGWDGVKSCLINAVDSAACIDTDGDGWGWDGTASCLIGSVSPVNVCIDTDGDGWGWDGVGSCRVGDAVPDPMPAAGNIVQTAVSANFTVLATALQLTGLDSVLSDDTAEFTVFAPTDAAFESLGADALNALTADPTALSQVLLGHVLPGRVDAAAALDAVGSLVETAAGTKLALSFNDGSLYVNTSRVTATDVPASNGIIHVIDQVILPRPVTQVSGTIVDVAVADGNFGTLVEALTATDLVSVLADTSAEYTVFAPTDEAFKLLGEDTIAALLSDTDTLKQILLTHVLAGAVDSTTALSLTGGSVETASGVSVDLSIRENQLYVNDSRVVTADIVTDNGIIHVIDAVIQ